MPETHSNPASERLDLRRPKLALSALRTVLEELAERIDPGERDLCRRALSRLADLHTELDSMESDATPDSGHPAISCTLNEICQAARQSLPAALRDRVLIATQQPHHSITIDDAQLIVELRNLAQSMFTRGANAILFNASLEDSEAVFALIDDRQGPAPVSTPVEPLVLPDVADLKGSVTAIGSAKNPQGVIVRIPVRRAALAHPSPAAIGGSQR